MNQLKIMVKQWFDHNCDTVVTNYFFILDITLNFPLSTHETGLPCLIKVYENFDSFKINDIVEFIGILSQDPSLAYMHDEHTDAVYMSLREQQMKLPAENEEENSMETESAQTLEEFV